MTNGDPSERAMEIGRALAETVLEYRRERLALREQALRSHPNPLQLRIQPLSKEGQPTAAPSEMKTAGTLVAEGDSWFDYPLHDILEELEDRHGYDIESVAHHGDPIEVMAYGGHQLEQFSRRIEKILRRGTQPKAILLSGGGDDVAGSEFGMLLNHAKSAIAGLNDSVVEGVIQQRIRIAYLTIIHSVTELCTKQIGHPIPILIHGYDYPVPDGRGFAGGWGPLPGPWLEPGFREKGFQELQKRIELAHVLIDRFNVMVAAIPSQPSCSHVRFIDLRGTLSTRTDYEDWWANELHPTPPGFEKVAKAFADVLASLP